MLYESRFEVPTDVSDQSYKDYQEFQKNMRPSTQKRLLISSLVSGIALSTFTTTIVYAAVPHAELSVYAITFLTAFPTGATFGIIGAAIWKPSQKRLNVV